MSSPGPDCSKSAGLLGLISSRYGSPVIYPPPNCGVGQGTRAHKTAENRAYRFVPYS